MQPPLHAGSCGLDRGASPAGVDKWCVIFHMPVPSGEAVTTRVLLRDEAYARLRDAILDGTLEAGEQLRDAELSSWLGISRTPIREALARHDDPRRFRRGREDRARRGEREGSLP